MQLSMNKERGSEDEIVPPVSLVARLPAIPSILSAFTVRVSGAIKPDLDPAPAAANSFLVFFKAPWTKIGRIREGTSENRICKTVLTKVNQTWLQPRYTHALCSIPV